MIKLLGIPYDANSSFVRGPALAPAAIRLFHHQGAANPSAENHKTIRFGINLTDLGDLSFPSDDSESAHKAIREAVFHHIQDGSKLIALGGDHSISYPIVEAFAKLYQGLHILHLDAHADLYHNFQDNYYSHASPFARIMELKLAASLTSVGIRTLTQHQRKQAEKYQVKIIEMKDFNLDFLQDLKDPLYISFDMDALDPSSVPGVSHHEPGGMSVRTALQCLQGIRVNIVGADIVEFNPTRDVHQMTAAVSYKLLKEIWSLM